ncbi:uncharacterized protein LOC109604910 [Aethina tumida]|uniref:uncharacterized protein LOC109604910 n=1 Tax=Aethina tumida TaxID=116153 RepID=UPI0021481FCA|nr:uncharacterized protein LOC109604910 [Aethina tumida]
MTCLNWGRSVNTFNASSVHTSGGSSKTSSYPEYKVVVAITEGRGEARCEVGLAVININYPALILCQTSDTHSYINTLTKINVFNPVEVIVPKTFIETFAGNRLVDAVKKFFPHIKITTVARNTYNKNRGLERLQELCPPSLNSIILIVKHKYYALAAVAALLAHTCMSYHTYYASGTLKVDYEESEGYSFIDVATADRLELLTSSQPGQATKYSSLLGVLNKCFTKVGTRTLRSAILQPLYDVQLIEERLNCVTELVNNREMALSLQQVLQKVPNIDQLLSIALIIQDDVQNPSNRHLNYILLLNTIVDIVSPLKEILSKAKEHFFLSIAQFLSDKCFVDMKDMVRKMIHENVHPVSGSSGIHQKCFAIKPGINGLLDIIRTTYSERIDELKDYVKTLAEKYALPLTLGNNVAKGYHIILTLNKHQKSTIKISDLPSVFFQVKRLSGSFTMKTIHLENLSTRIEDILIDILRISNTMIYQILIDLKQYIHVLHRLCDVIAHLDMIQSLAEASVNYSYVRPKFSEHTEIVHAFHPLLDFLCPVKPVANSIVASKEHNVNIITGPSGSGKSIFIRQMMLLQVMAQIGCYVPAESATFRPADKMFSRIYLEDDMEFGVSSFVLEMKEIQYMLTAMTPNSLIIIDELGRSTSVEEGMSMAIAICEKIATFPAFLFITTHFSSLSNINDMYLNIKTWQMETIITGDSPSTTKLDYRYNLKPAPTSIDQYGVYMVRNVWSDEVVNFVEDTLQNITFNYQQIDERIRLKYDLEAKLRLLKKKGKLTRALLNKYLNEYQNELEKHNFTFVIESQCYVSNSTYSTSNNLTFPGCNELNNTDVAYTSQFTQNSIDTVHYQNLSKFLNENSQNLEVIIPEISLSCQDFGQKVVTESNNNIFIENKSTECSVDICNLEAFALPLLRDHTKTSTPQIKEVEAPQKTRISETPSKDDVFEETLIQSELEICSQLLSNCSSFDEGIINQDLEDNICCNGSMENDPNDDVSQQEKSLLSYKEKIFDEAIKRAASYEGITPRETEIIEEEFYKYRGQYEHHIIPNVIILMGTNDKSVSVNSNSDKSLYENFSNEVSEYNFTKFNEFNVEYNTDPKKFGKTTSSISANNNKSSIKEITNLITDTAGSSADNISPKEIRNNLSITEGLSMISRKRLLTNTEPSFVNKSNNSLVLSNKKRVKIESTLTSSKSKENQLSFEKMTVLITQDPNKVNGYTDLVASTPVSSKETMLKQNWRTNDMKIKQKGIKNKFVPPMKLTSKNIKEQFKEQDKKLLEISPNAFDYSRHLLNYVNRPSVKQVINQRPLVHAMKTVAGVQITSVETKSNKKRNMDIQKAWSNENFDITMFSDENAKLFEDFLSCKDNDIQMFNFKKTKVSLFASSGANNNVFEYYNKHREGAQSTVMSKDEGSLGFYMKPLYDVTNTNLFGNINVKRSNSSDIFGESSENLPSSANDHQLLNNMTTYPSYTSNVSINVEMAKHGNSLKKLSLEGVNTAPNDSQYVASKRYKNNIEGFHKIINNYLDDSVMNTKKKSIFEDTLDCDMSL